MSDSSTNKPYLDRPAQTGRHYQRSGSESGEDKSVVHREDGNKGDGGASDQFLLMKWKEQSARMSVGPGTVR